MSENQQSNHDPLEEAIRAFQGMTVCERPPDAAVLARFGVFQGAVSQPSSIAIPSKRRRIMPLFGSALAAAVLLAGGLALLLHNIPQPDPGQAVATDPPDEAPDAAVQPPPESEGLAVPSREEQVAESQVILVATGLDAAPAPPGVPGDSPEVFIRWKVKRVLKGKLGKKEFTTRTSPEDEFIGNEWIIFLTPDYMKGKHQLATYTHIEYEPFIKEVIAKEKK